MKRQLKVEFKLNRAYMLWCENTEGSSGRSESGTEEVPNNSIGKSDGSSSNSVCRTALSCSCA